MYTTLCAFAVMCVCVCVCVCACLCVCVYVYVRVIILYTKTTHYKNEENITIKNYYITILPRVNNISSTIDS